MAKFKTLEKVLKGAANHWRLKILFLLQAESNLSLTGISDKLEGNFKTISEHTKKLLESGLIEKRYRERTVLHSLTGLGKEFLNSIKKFG